jgi:DNA-binding NtrC family response regulator
MKVLYMSGYAGNAINNHGILPWDAPLLEKPFTPEALCETVRASLESPPPALRILIVDDEPGLRDWLQDILSESGYRACTASNGRDARKRYQIEQFDLVITDLAMPEEEGIEMIMALRRKVPQLKIIAISGAFGRDALDAAEVLGANMSLAKPLSGDTILRSVREVMAGVARS